MCNFYFGVRLLEYGGNESQQGQHYRLKSDQRFRCTGKLLPDAGVPEALDCQGAQDKVHEQQRGETHRRV